MQDLAGGWRQATRQADRPRAKLPLAAGAALLLLVASPPARADMPNAGIDAFDSEMNVVLEMPQFGFSSTITLQGATVVLRGNPALNPGVDCAIPTEIVAMNLTANDPDFGAVRVRINPEQSSTGEVRSQQPSCTFPADSFFDVFVVVEIPAFGFELINLQPVRVEAQGLQKLPPILDTYTHPPPAIPLVHRSNPGGPQIAQIAGGSTHQPVQRPSFSVAPQGPTGLHPADLHRFGNPPIVGLPRSALGLGNGDDVDGLSYGTETIDVPGVTTVAFSVAPGSTGAPNTGVNREATIAPNAPEVEGDEYVSHFNNTNQLLIDEQSIVLQTGAPDDDIDALDDQPPSFADSNGDGVLEKPVYFSLAPGSSTLTALAASPAAILATPAGGGAPAVWATPASLGLTASDDLDAMCLMKAYLGGTAPRESTGVPPGVPPVGNSMTDFVLFSLAPGSPLLTTLGASPADLFISGFAGSNAIYAPASALGLVVSDDLDALKCLMAAALIEITGTPATAGGVTGNAGLLNDGSHLAPPAPNVGSWAVINPEIGHFDGPFAFPNVPNPLGLAVLAPDDMTIVNLWRPPDACRYWHLHFLAFTHADPTAGLRCGHGGRVDFTQWRTVLLGALALQVAADLSALLDGVLQSFGPNAFAAAHAFAAAGAPLGAYSTAASPDTNHDGALMVVAGTGRTRLDVLKSGAAGMSLSQPLASFSLPLIAPPPDFDADGVPDASDNCVLVANASQADAGGVGLGSPSDGVGDGCQCGDVNDDGFVTGLDGTLVKRAALGLAPFGAAGVSALAAPQKCDVNGGTTGDATYHCSGLDGTIIQRDSLGLSPNVLQVCPAADGN